MTNEAVKRLWGWELLISDLQRHPGFKARSTLSSANWACLTKPRAEGALKALAVVDISSEPLRGTTRQRGCY